MKDIKKLQEELESIKQRNIKVELDKAWETSHERKIIIAVFTYITVVVFFYFAKLPNPLINSIVPSLAFILSTLTLPFFKEMWISNRR